MDAPPVTEGVRSTRMPRVRRSVVHSDIPREERAPPVAPRGPSRKEPAAPRRGCSFESELRGQVSAA